MAQLSLGALLGLPGVLLDCRCRCSKLQRVLVEQVMDRWFDVVLPFRQRRL